MYLGELFLPSFCTLAIARITSSCNLFTLHLASTRWNDAVVRLLIDGEPISWPPRMGTPLHLV